jgi:8-oxo-dGTP diphosphatase
MINQIWRYSKTIMGILFRHPITGTTLICQLHPGEIILVQKRQGGKWGLPGGIIDWGEDIPTAARRELHEETGLNLIEIQQVTGVYSHPDRDPRMHSISIVLEVRASGDFAIQDTQEIAEVRSCPIEEIPFQNLCHDHERQLRDYLNGVRAIA